jgi:hypothetical protein
MTEATMRGLLRSAAHRVPLLALLAFSTAYAPGVSAQTTGTGTTTTQSANQAIDANLVVRRGTDLVDNGTLVFANINDCGGEDSKGTATRFEFSATYTANVPVVELWLGVGSSENCATASNRLRPANNGTLPPVCTFLGTDTSNTRNPKITIPGNQLFNQTSGMANPADTPIDLTKSVCDKTNGGQTYTVYFIPLQTQTTNVNGSEPITVGALSTLRAVFTPYTQRPAAPSGLSGQSGESEIGVTFKAPSSSMTLTKYKAYFDISGGSGVAPAPLDGGLGLDASVGISDGGLPGETPVDDDRLDASVDAGSIDAGAVETADEPSAAACGEGYLVGGQLAPLNPPVSKVVSVSPSKAVTSIKLTQVDEIKVGANVAVSVVSIDPAGNESLLSPPICVEKVNTTGFLDACEQTGNCRDELGSCSLSPKQSGSALFLSMFSLALAALLRRRSRA